MKKQREYIVVDDDQTSNMICSFLLAKFDPDAAVVLFNNPTVALQSFLNKEEGEIRDKRITVFLDLNMPLMSGWDFLDELSREKPDILKQLEIYILSSSIEDFSSKREKYPYLAGFLSKPLSKAHLQEIDERQSNFGKRASNF
jgi:CheY-like chemotaxis protein